MHRARTRAVLGVRHSFVTPSYRHEKKDYKVLYIFITLR